MSTATQDGTPKVAMKAATKETPSPQVEISRIGTETILVPIEGLSPLIVHRFSEKAKRKMLDGFQGRRSPKEPKDPEQEYLDSLYRMDDDRYGFPVLAFKAATVGAARFYGKDVSMVMLRQTLFMAGEFSHRSGMSLVHIVGEPRMREDVATVGRGVADLRYRGEFLPWSTTLRVTYVISALTRDSVVSLIDAGGLGVGVGEWRPERNGDFGQFRVADEAGIEVSA